MFAYAGMIFIPLPSVSCMLSVHCRRFITWNYYHGYMTSSKSSVVLYYIINTYHKLMLNKSVGGFEKDETDGSVLAEQLRMHK